MTTQVAIPRDIAKPSAPPSTAPEPAAQRTCILAVDDEPRTLYALKELLEAPDTEVVLAHSGEEALQQVLKRDFAVILLDVRMPGMDGFETARLLRGRERSQAHADHLPHRRLGRHREHVQGLPDRRRGLPDQAGAGPRGAALEGRGVRRPLPQERGAARSEEQLRLLAGYLLGVREEERAHIAREIHDELGQVLTALKMDVSWIAKTSTASSARSCEKTTSMCRLIDSTVRTVRRIAAGLRPEVLDEMGLAAAIGWQAKEFQKRSGVRVKLELAAGPAEVPPGRVYGGVPDLPGDPDQRRAPFARDAAGHPAGALGDQLFLEVKDNGVGMPSTEVSGRKSLGLLGMQERALLFGGTVQFTSATDKGTTVTVTIPMARAL